jgi:hypothetical protein
VQLSLSEQPGQPGKVVGGQSRRSLRVSRSSGVRTFADLRFLHFADAAWLRACGMPVAAMQLMSPKRSLNPTKRRRTQTALSLRPVSTIETRTKWTFDREYASTLTENSFQKADD